VHFFGQFILYTTPEDVFSHFPVEAYNLQVCLFAN
jgi:hypothetical protein